MKATRQPLTSILPVKFTCQRRCGKAGKKPKSGVMELIRYAFRVPGHELKLESAFTMQYA